MKICLQDSAFAHTKTKNTHDLVPTRIEWERRNPNSNDIVVYTDQEIPKVSQAGQTKIAWLMEPRPLMPYLYDMVTLRPEFDYVFTHDKVLLEQCDKARFVPYGGCWIRPQDFGRLDHDRNPFVSIVASKKQYTFGQRLRHQIVNRFKDQLSVYGRAYKEIDDKGQAFFPYLFHVVVENVKLDYWFTEKLIDSLVTKTVPIYWGCPSIDRFFNPDGMFIFNTLDELNSILEQLKDNDDATRIYRDKFDAIEENYLLALQYISCDNNFARTLQVVI